MSSYVFLLLKQHSIGLQFTIFDFEHYAVVEFLNYVTFVIPSNATSKNVINK